MTRPSPTTPVPAKRPARRSHPTQVQVRPDFFIVGAPKCGTTALSDYLANHPDIFMARKEMHFFGRDLHFAPHFYRRAEPEYLAEFAGWSGQARVGEASVWYLFSERAAAEIKAFNPAARIIILLREPVEMMYSLFRYFQYDGNESLSSFAAALQAEPDRRAGRRLGRQTYFAPGLAYRDTARYAPQVERYLQVFGRDRVLVLLYEDLAANPAAVYQQTLRFLGVDDSHSLAEFPRVNAAKTVRSRALRAVLNDPTARSAMLAIRPLLPGPIFDGFHQVEDVLKRFNSRLQRPVPLAPKLKAELRREFAPEVARLARLLGRELTPWTQPAGPPRRSPDERAL